MNGKILAVLILLGLTGQAHPQQLAGDMVPSHSAIAIGAGVSGAPGQAVDSRGETSRFRTANLDSGAGHPGAPSPARTSDPQYAFAESAPAPSVSALPHAATLAALKAWPTSAGTVLRDGVASVNDSGGPLIYAWSSAPCALNGGAGDDGWQVQGKTGCWIAALPTSGADIRIWGASSSAPDNSAAFLAAARAASQGQGGGLVLVPPTYLKVAQSANLDLSPYSNIKIGCVGGTTGQQVTSNLTAPCTLQVNPSYSINMGTNQELYGLRIVNQNAEQAGYRDVRAALTAVNAFAGTGLVITHNDVNIHDLTINGFNQAVITQHAPGRAILMRVKLDNVVGDDTNFISMNDCGDTCEVTRVEAWNFLTNLAGAANYTIAGVSNLNGLFEITVGGQLEPERPVPLVTGDTVVIGGISGPNQPLGRYTITVVDSTHVTLNGSTYSQGYLFGGTIGLPSGIRKGIAFEFTGTGIGGQYLSSIWEYGHDVGVHVGPAHGPVDIYFLWLDGPPYLTDHVPVGIDYEGHGSGVFGGALLNKAITVLSNSTDGWRRPFTINGVSSLQASGCKAGISAGSAVTIVHGAVSISNSFITPSCPAGYDALSLGPGAGPLKISNTNLNGTGVATQTAVECLNVTIDGASRNCTPPTSSAKCAPGQMSWDGGYVYVCVAPNKWRRAATSAF